MNTVRLKIDWPGNFARTVYDDNGNPIERLVFAPGVPRVFPLPGQHEADEQRRFDAIESDIGAALEIVA